MSTASHRARFEAEPELRERFVESGRAGAMRRWARPGARIHLDLGDLPVPQRAAVVALVEALKEAQDGQR
jgi:hypothetical protein